jgi:signal transduction histidine kinase
MASLARSSAVSDIRNALARDLHDSVAQFLAGTLFRLEALRRWLREGNNPDGEINAMKEALRREQAQLRLMVDRLRRGEEGDRRTDLAEEIETLLEEMGHHWHISTRMDIDARPVPVPMQLAYELRQVVREAVANAARHGQCSHVGISLAREADGQLKLSIGDNGKGFPLEAGAPRPRSISERVEALGGRLNISNAGPGARLEIIINTRVAA